MSQEICERGKNNKFKQQLTGLRTRAIDMGDNNGGWIEKTYAGLPASARWIWAPPGWNNAPENIYCRSSRFACQFCGDGVVRICRDLLKYSQLELT